MKAPFLRAGIVLPLLILVFLPSQQSFAQSEPFLCGTRPPARSGQALLSTIDPHGGAHLPSSDTIRALIYFVQFPEDPYPDELWERGRNPLWSERFAQGLTDYFREMSFGRLIFLFEIRPLPVILPRREVDYLVDNKNYGDASREIVRMLDAEYDFTRFDRWNAQDRAYRIEKSPDGRVDLVIQIYRSAGWNFLPFSGVSDLGFEGYEFVDDMQRFFYGGNGAFSDAAASGVTLVNHYGSPPVTGYDYAFGIAAHEIMHKIYGEGHPARLFGGLGLLGSSGAGMGLNSFERQTLGMIAMREIPFGTDTIVTLRDYMTTGDALLVPVPLRDNLYYSFEYRRKISQYDTAPIRGLYIYRIDNSGGRNQKEVVVQSADGKWRWRFDSTLNRPVKSVPDLLTGYNKLQAIPIEGRNTYAWGWWGDSTDAYTPANPWFSWWRNPSPDCVMGVDTIRTGMSCELLALTDSTARVAIRYRAPDILPVEETASEAFSLGQNYPNPASGGASATIPFSVASQGRVRLTIRSLLGMHVRTIAEEELPPGRYERRVDLAGMPSGVYIYTLESGAGVRRRLLRVVR